jgi:hypothetical protein
MKFNFINAGREFRQTGQLVLSNDKGGFLEIQISHL